MSLTTFSYDFFTPSKYKILTNTKETSVTFINARSEYILKARLQQEIANSKAALIEVVFTDFHTRQTFKIT